MTGIATNQMAIRDELASGVCLTTDELDKALPNIKRRQLVMAVGKMITKGLAERVERGCYKLTKHGLKTHCAGVKLTSGPNGKHTGPKRPLPNTLLQRAWNVMRISQSFTIPDLVLVAAVDEKNSYQQSATLCQGAGAGRLLAGASEQGAGYRAGIKRLQALPAVERHGRNCACIAAFQKHNF